MSTADTLPIYYTQDVLGFYQKQKSEFHFQQKSDNEFLMFLLDTAVRVISIVQHLAPVIEAVSDASAEVDELDDMSSIATPPTSNNSGIMEVDNMTDTNPTQTAVPPLSAELEQINLEITNSQISSQPSQPIHSQTVQPIPKPGQNHNVPVMQSVSHLTKTQLPKPQLPKPQLPKPQLPQSQTPRSQPPQSQVAIPQPPQLISAAPQNKVIVSPIQIHSQLQTTQPPAESGESFPPPIPQPQPVSSAQSNVSQNMSTDQPSATQPIAEAPLDSDISQFKSEENPIPEVIEIKEEFNDTANDAIQTSASSNLISQDTLQQLMSSISNNEENVGIQNFITTAAPSNLPPSFLDRSSTNPLSMLGSLNSGDTPGPSGINVPNIPESMMKNINDAGLNVSNIKGQANPSSPEQPAPVPLKCPVCSKMIKRLTDLRRHISSVHLGDRKYSCPFCVKSFTRSDIRKKHVSHVHANLHKPVGKFVMGDENKDTGI